MLSQVQFFVFPWTVAHEDPPSLEFSRQEYWSGLPFPYARMDESQTAIKTAGRNITLRYTDDTTLMEESKKELKSLLIKVKESEKVGLKLHIQKT